jgi:hypothetical protein
MNLSEMLALLPDNTTGEISPADLRAIVNDLYTSANTVTESWAYDWTTDTTPQAGKICANNGWSMTTTMLHVSETTGEGMLMSFAAVDRQTSPVHLELASPGHKMHVLVIGPSVDQGHYRDVPVQTMTVVGTSPVNNDLMTLAAAVLPAA